MKIMITGGAGFIGSNTADLLIKQGHEVVVFDNFTSGKSENVVSFREDGGAIEIGNVSDYKNIEQVVKTYRPEAVLHLAAQPAITLSMKDPVHDLSVNSIGTIHTLTASRKYGVEKFVFSSTAAVYRAFGAPKSMTEGWDRYPESPYGISKLAAELYVRFLFKNSIILRYGNVYGPRQHPLGENQVIARAIRHLEKGDDFKVVGDGKQTRDFVYVGDIAELNSLALGSDEIGTFNAATGKSHSVNQMLKFLEEAYGLPHRYKWEHTKTPDPRGDVSMNVKLIRKHLGWSARMSAPVGLKKTVEWWQENG